jgi:hypothetical protein
VGKARGSKVGHRKPKAVAPPKFEDYWKLRMDGATLRLKAAQQIVSHTGTRGSLAENLLRELIREFLPQRWAVGTGFIMDSTTDTAGKITRRRSNQVDILIYDQHEHSPVFKDGDLVVLSPGTAKVAIEVKSSLETNDTPDAYDNICSIKAVDAGLQGFIFGYDGAQYKTFAEHVKQWSNVTVSGRELWPERVFNMGQKFLVMPDPSYNVGVAERRFVVAAEKDPIVQLFLTAVLAQAGVDSLRAFFLTQDTGDELMIF